MKTLYHRLPEQLKIISTTRTTQWGIRRKKDTVSEKVQMENIPDYQFFFNF